MEVRAHYPIEYSYITNAYFIIGLLYNCILGNPMFRISNFYLVLCRCLKFIFYLFIINQEVIIYRRKCFRFEHWWRHWISQAIKAVGEEELADGRINRFCFCLSIRFIVSFTPPPWKIPGPTWLHRSELAHNLRLSI